MKPFFALLFLAATLVGSPSLKETIINCYGVDERRAEVIVDKFSPLHGTPEGEAIINDFIKKSESLKLDLSRVSSSPLSLEDAICKAADFHQILFENGAVRILWSRSVPGDVEPYHSHQWKSLFVMTEATSFKIENADGKIEVGDWPLGVYELDADEVPASYINLGPGNFQAILFEIKD